MNDKLLGEDHVLDGEYDKKITESVDRYEGLREVLDKIIEDIKKDSYLIGKWREESFLIVASTALKLIDKYFDEETKVIDAKNMIFDIIDRINISLVSVEYIKNKLKYEKEE